MLLLSTLSIITDPPSFTDISPVEIVVCHMPKTTTVLVVFFYINLYSKEIPSKIRLYSSLSVGIILITTGLSLSALSLDASPIK